jgi:hypothetical protein
MKQAVHKFSGSLGPVHSVNFFFRRGKTTIRNEQIIRKNGVQQMIKGRIRHHITKIFMMFSVIPNGDLGGGTMKFDQGFTISTGRGGGSGWRTPESCGTGHACSFPL